MNRMLRRKLIAQLDLLLPGGEGWPRYSEADTGAYWFGWRERTPLSTRLALALSVWVLGLYGWLHGLRGGPGADPAQAMARAERSRIFTVRQSFVLIKTIGCLGYFSDPRVLALGRSRGEVAT